jgi:RNA polymerase sigma-70 factor (sigma-E family)
MLTPNTVVTNGGSGVSDDFAEYVAVRGPAMLRLAFVLTGNAADAEDVVQDALSRALPRWSRICAAEDVDAYVRRMVVNAHVSWWRRFRRKESPVEAVHDGHRGHAHDTADTVLAGMSDERLWRACTELPRDQRVAVVLRYYEQLSYAEIAHLVGCAEPTARSRVFRGLAALRELLGEEA